MSNVKNIVKLALAVSLAVGGAMAQQSAEPPRIEVPVIDTPPVMDGRLDDAVWQDAVRLDAFHVYRGDARADATTVLLARDDKWLFIGLDCANPNMVFLDQLGREHDASASIIRDDSVEIFLTRDGLENYFHYMMNFAGMRAEQRISKLGTGRDFSWNYPWVGVTARTATNWTAEVALPLEIINSAKPGDLRLNLLRNKIEVELDQMGAKNSERRAHHFWAPVEKSAHEPEKFGVLQGLTDTRFAAPFLPQVDRLETGNLKLDGDVFSFDVAFRLIGRSPIGGAARVIIADGTGKTGTLLLEETLDLPPRAEQSCTFTIPVEDFSPKVLALKIEDRATGMILDQRALDFQGTLIVDAYPEFSFYSHEETLRVKAALALTEDAMRGMTLSLSDKRGRELIAVNNPLRETVLAASADVLELGANGLSVVLKRADGRVLGTYALSVRRLPPGTGSETKVDHFRRIVLLNGKPFFPFGMYVADHGMYAPEIHIPIMDLLERSGMNAVIMGSSAFQDAAAAETDKMLAAVAARRGIYYGVWSGFRQITGHRELGGDRPFSSAKAALAGQIYAGALETNVVNAMVTMRDVPNFLFWYGWDESNLGDWQLNLHVQKQFFQTQREYDPHHLMFGLYARYIPPVPAAVDYFDVLGYDVYTYTEWENRRHAEVAGAMAAQVAQLDARAAEKRQPIWMVPTGTKLDPGRSPQPLTGQEQLCQSYVATIYGARGLLYFTYTVTYGQDTWHAMRELGMHIEQLAPAILNDAVDQEVTYACGDYDVARWQIPPVPMCFFRYPDGRVVAMAVNANNYPADTTFNIAGLRGVRRMFGDQAVFKVEDGQFTERLEPFAVRAYAMEIDTPSHLTLKARITAQGVLEAAKTVPDNEAIIAAAQMRKNLVLNPSFELRWKNPKIPDFHSPYRVLEVDQLGEPGSRWFLDSANPKFGEVSLRMRGYPREPHALRVWRAGVFGTFARPANPAVPHVFSFYARAAADGAQLWVGLPAGGRGAWDEKTFTLSTEWARYSMPADVKDLGVNWSFLIQPQGDDMIFWIDGLQLEAGETPTEFEE